MNIELPDKLSASDVRAKFEAAYRRLFARTPPGAAIEFVALRLSLTAPMPGTGGTLERPALRRKLADIERGLIDVVVVFKIDRLSPALIDFAKLVKVFDANSATSVSVTQPFNTTISMGKLTLNILLSFAQFEREVIGERIRDKVGASRARGIWMGRFLPLGCAARDRKLLVNDVEAALVRRIFDGFVETECHPVTLKGVAASSTATTSASRC